MQAVYDCEEDDELELRAQLRVATDPYIQKQKEVGPKIGTIEERINADKDQIEDLDEDRSYIPYVGKRFSSHEEAYKFYNNYALRVGFSVRRGSGTISMQGVSSKRFLCNKEGRGKREKNEEMPIGSLNKPKTPEKVKGITRVQCKASCRLRLVEHGVWKVSVFEEQHNHLLITSPSKKRNLRSHKGINQDQVETIQNLSAQNVGTSQILEYIAMFCSGKGNLRFKKQDVINVITTINRKLSGIDVSTTEDPEFFLPWSPMRMGPLKTYFELMVEQEEHIKNSVML